MIKPVTYQGVFNFNANLYALEVKSRFIDQSKANGYYRGYGDELNATLIGNQIRVGTGAFVIQGRMNEITVAETVTPDIAEGLVGYVVARIETYHPSDEENCTLAAIVGNSFDEIELTQEDTYEPSADKQNKVYELPIYSFTISGGAISNLKKLIGAVDDYATIKGIVDNALGEAKTAVQTANSANSKSDAAVSTANSANSNSQNAVQTANKAAETVRTEHEEMTKEIEHLADLIAEGQGTVVKRNGERLAEYNIDNVVETTDTITLDGGSV